MRAYPEELWGNTWRSIVSWVYQAILCMYPKNFRHRFGFEMNAVFQEALEEQARKGTYKTFIFLGRELFEAPVNIFNQHLVAKTLWTHPYSINILAFMFGFTLLGLTDILIYHLGINGTQRYFLNGFSFLLAGLIGSLAMGSVLDPYRKKTFAFFGAIGFLLANTLGKEIYINLFPDTLATPGSGIYFLLPFLYPILMGSIFGLFIGIASKKWHGLLGYISMGSLVFFAGFFVNRLAAALLQSYLFHGTIQTIEQTGIGNLFIYIVLPCLLEGMLMGVLFGGITQKSISIRA